ncbi:centriolar and ciliogenesis-associated protein HYSL1 isoform X2 [Lampris incognitus]|uniref:centriolar and ciliogenesis-associated protein HYSL1 isoform X2 n=1 Tax=Lampris incognitus TaxID=2546036 RepID=UPI0024B5CF4C|nr:centriolar and ciliogenesis-associated protein HYSL1 isoform X2 [Lampris incognitus]
MENLDFSEEEIEQQLAVLGYRNIPKHRLRAFKRDLDELIQQGSLKSQASFVKENSSNSQTTMSKTGPPAYTKEKVSRYHITDPGNGFFLHAGNLHQERQVFNSCQNKDYGPRQDYVDSYAQHSVSTKCSYNSVAPTRLEVELEPEPEPADTRSPPFSVSQSSTPVGEAHERHFIKRKVLRKHEGQLFVCDESRHSEDSDAESGLEDRLARLHVSRLVQPDVETENEDLTSQEELSTDTDGLSLNAFESYIRGITEMQHWNELRPRPKSFIRPQLHRHMRNLKKNDPVKLYFQYKQDWNMFKVPGENDKRTLRREIRQQLAYQPPAPKPRRVYVPNSYIVPTEKKRSALRWEIRNDLAKGLLPSRLKYHF